METILLIGIIQSTIFLLLNIQKSQKTKADAILLIWLLIFGLHLAFLLLFENNIYSRLTIVISKTMVLLHGPILLIYANSALKARNSLKLLYHIVPFFIFTLLGLLVTKKYVIEWENAIVIAKLISIISYPTYTLFWLRKRYNFFKTEKSNNIVLEIRWIRTLAYLLLFSFSISIAFIIINEIFNLKLYNIYDIIIYVVMITIMGYYGLKLGIVYKYETQDEDIIESVTKSVDRYKHSPLDRKRLREIKNLIEFFFDSHEDFLNSDFSLTQLSKHLDIPKHHLSQVINSEMETSFYDIVNSKRVEFVKAQLKSKKKDNITLEALGYDAGFNTKAAFYFHFKKSTGLTPGQFKKKISID